MKNQRLNSLNRKICVALLMMGICMGAGEIRLWAQNTTFKIAGYDIEVIGDMKDFSITAKTEKIEDGLEVARITLTSSEPSVPPQFSLKWGTPSQDIVGHWTTGKIVDKTIRPDWSGSRLETSMLARNAPVSCVFGSDNVNRLTFALSDALNTIRLGSGIREEDGVVYNEVVFFTEPHGSITKYEVDLRVDNRNIPYYDALEAVGKWWETYPEYKPATVPEAAKQAIYSTWYNYHQNIGSEVLLKEMKIAKEMGFETIIVDDGWQTMDSNRGYAYTGDWEPERMPDMKMFVDSCHKIGVKVVLWYAVPFFGEKSKIAEQFKGKALRHVGYLDTYVFDPRFPEVREYIINIYKKAIEEWDIDGFKLDFIENFAADKNTVFEATEGRDIASVNEATDKVMTDIITELKKIKSDVLIEFRQPYIGPLMRKYGNMFRASDCPNSYTANKIKTADLRILSGNTVTHADPLMWHYGEPVEIAALQFSNTLFSVPQVSVRLEEIPQEHFNMIRFYTQYWKKNKNILLEGDFDALYPMSNYPILKGYSEDKQIIGLYADMVINLDDDKPTKNIDIVNAKKSEEIILNVPKDSGKYNYIIYDCQGKTVKEEQLKLNQGVVSFSVPVSGILSFEKMD